MTIGNDLYLINEYIRCAKEISMEFVEKYENGERLTSDEKRGISKAFKKIRDIQKNIYYVGVKTCCNKTVGI